MQTLFAVLFRKHPPSIKYTRTFVGLNDGGHVALDWLDPFEPGKPTLLLLHGLTGGSDETCVRDAAARVHTTTTTPTCLVSSADTSSGCCTPRHPRAYSASS